jgi:hypothetical protein
MLLAAVTFADSTICTRRSVADGSIGCFVFAAKTAARGLYLRYEKVRFIVSEAGLTENNGYLSGLDIRWYQDSFARARSH